MDSAKYWRKRSLYAKQKQLDAEGEYEIAMRSRLKDLENEILKEADYFITRYAETNEISKKNAAEILSKIDTSKFDMTLKEFRAKAIAGGFEKELDSAYLKTRINRLQKLHAQLADLASKYAETEEQRMALALAEQYKGTYELQEYHKYLVVGGLDVDFAHFDEQQLKDIVYQPWQGSDFSKRIWNNYTKVMPDVLTDVIARSVLMGYSHQRVEKMLRDRFRGIEDKNLHRLAVTEMGHAAEQATLEFYKDSNIDQYQYLATLESRTCDVCGHLDQKVFNVKDEKEGINYPLIHPYCRCTTVPYDPDLPDTPTRWSRDPITGKGKIIKNMSYSEWAEANGVKPLNKKKFIETPKLTKNEKRAVTDYVSPAAYDLNDRLRNNYQLSKEQKAMVKNLDSALEKISYYSDKEPLNRSLKFMWPDDEESFIRNTISKGYIQEKSYVSSVQHGVYDKDDHVRIIIEKSHSGRDLREFTLDGENEVLFNRNTKFIVKNYYKKHGKTFFEVIEDEK